MWYILLLKKSYVNSNFLLDPFLILSNGRIIISKIFCGPKNADNFFFGSCSKKCGRNNVETRDVVPMHLRPRYFGPDFFTSFWALKISILFTHKVMKIQEKMTENINLYLTPTLSEFQMVQHFPLFHSHYPLFEFF